MFTNYLFNTYWINPAETGIRTEPVLTSLFRWQWLGIDGAPFSRTISFESPYKEKWGIGFGIMDDRLGPSVHQVINASLSRRVRLSEKFTLSMGLSAVANIQQLRLAELPDLVDLVDANLNNDYRSFNPNVGGGIRIASDKLFFGISLPKFIEYRLTKNNLVSLDQVRHMFFYGGYKIELPSGFIIKPSFLVKQIKGQPTQLDLNTMVTLNRVLDAGLAYRNGDSMGFMLSMNGSENFKINYVFEYPINDVALLLAKTHEIGVSYRIVKRDQSPLARTVGFTY